MGFEDNNDKRKAIIIPRSGVAPVQIGSSQISSGIRKIQVSFPENNDPKISVIVIANNGYEYTKSCLYNLSKSSYGMDYEVILADNNSTDETIGIEDEVENLIVSRFSEDTSLIKLLNSAVEKAKGKYICFINNDSIPKENWLGHLFWTMEYTKKAGLVRSKIIYQNETYKEAGSSAVSKINCTVSSDLKPIKKIDVNQSDILFDGAFLIRKKHWKAFIKNNNELEDMETIESDLPYFLKKSYDAFTIYQPKSQLSDFNQERFKNALSLPRQFKSLEDNKIDSEYKNGIDINICFCLSDDYSKYAGCTIASILVNSNIIDTYNFYLLSDDISDESKKYFEELKSIRDFNLHFLNVDRGEFDDVKLANYLGLSTFYRFKIFDLIDKERVLYLDSDIIVRSDLRELYSINVEDYFCAGVKDSNETELKKIAKLDEKSSYINAGVILFNLTKCREEKISDKLFEFSKMPNKDLIHADQDVINSVLQGGIKILEDKWNCMYPSVEFVSKSAVSGDECISILHYLSLDKPWLLDWQPYKKNEYIDYMKLTPWYEYFIKEYYCLKET